MGVLIRAGWQALRRRLSPFPSPAAVRGALRGQASICAVETVEISAAAEGGPLVIVGLRIAEGADARTAACRASDRLNDRLPAADIRVHVSYGTTGLK